jgi:hypothetical protein
MLATLAILGGVWTNAAEAPRGGSTVQLVNAPEAASHAIHVVMPNVDVTKGAPPTQPGANNGAAGNGNAGGAAANGNSGGKKAPASPAGTWKWTTFNRSMQPIENVVTLTVDKKGNVIGTLMDRTGRHEVQSATVTDEAISFQVSYHSRGSGDLVHTFSLSRDPDHPAVTVDEPDFSPLGKANGNKRRHEAKAKHDTSE